MDHWWKNFSILLSVILLIETTTAASNLRWVRASNGAIPEYPVAGGEDYPGEVLYVARINLPSGPTPGKIDASSRMAHATWGGREYFKSEYEVLTNPGWRSHLEWKLSSGNIPPQNAVIGGYDSGRPLYVARFLYSDGHMIPGKAAYLLFDGLAHIGYGGKEYFEREWYVLVEHTNSRRKRGISSRSEYPDLPGVKPLQRAPIRDE